MLTDTQLAAMRATAESTMTATCAIRTDPEGTGDDTLDQNTGQLTRPVGEPSTIYTGKCRVAPEWQGQTDSEGRRIYTERNYSASIPWNAATPQVGSAFVVTASPNDPALVNRDMRVMTVEARTFAIERRMRLEDRTSP